MSLTIALKRQALALGLDAVGICDAAPFEREAAYLAERERAGARNPFEFPDLAPRVDPRASLPGARSIVAVAVSYHMPDAEGEAPELAGWLSRYCRGLDYHALIEGKLAALASWLEEQVPGAATFHHVDWGAPLDRAIAARAGIGKFGKSTNVITPRLGTWTFLGELITDVALEPDAPLAFSPCGSCTRCLDACPTGCLTAFELDANRCLGYVTQMDGVIPVAFRDVMGNRLFGCDDCQDVCPYNKAAASGRHPEFAPVAALSPAPDLVALARMTEREFDAWFAPTAAAWRGPEPLRRNAVIALGNTGRVEALAPLEAALGDASPLIRAHAAWALGRLAALAPDTAARARGALAARLDAETDPDVRAEIAGALAPQPTGAPR